MNKVIIATIGLKVKVNQMDAVIDQIFENRFIYCRYLNPDKFSGDGCATTGGITTEKGQIVKHPNYFKYQTMLN